MDFYINNWIYVRIIVLSNGVKDDKVFNIKTNGFIEKVKD